MNTDRIDLEAKVAFLERTLDTLSEELHEQGQTLDALTQRLSRLEARAASKGSDHEVGPHDAPPPHY